MADIDIAGNDAKAGRFATILFASDLTAYTDRALDRAAMLAAEHRAALHVLHVVDTTTLPERHASDRVRQAEERLRREVRDSGLDPRLDLTVEAARGAADKSIVGKAVAISADLIVMGLSHDVSLARIFRGTTIDRVVRQSRCPVLNVKTRPRRPYARVVVALDLGAPSRHALERALALFSDSELTVVHVDDASSTGAAPQASGQSERRQQIEDLVAASGLAAGRAGPNVAGGPSLGFGFGKPAEALQVEIGKIDPDLVVLGSHGRAGVSSVFLGSVAETMLEVLPFDVLVVRA